MTTDGTVALRANDAEPASIGAMAERQSRGAHVFTMHLNTWFSAHLILRVGPRGSMQQCRPCLHPEPSARPLRTRERCTSGAHPCCGLRRTRAGDLTGEPRWSECCLLYTSPS